MTHRLRQQRSTPVSSRLLVVAALVSGGCSGARSGCGQPPPQTPTGPTATAAATTATVTTTTTGAATVNGTSPLSTAGGWAQRFGGPGDDWAGSLAVGPTGPILLAGRFQQTASFGGAPLTSAEDGSPVLASYTTTGQHRWSLASVAGVPLPPTGAGEPALLSVGDEQHPAALVAYSATGTADSTTPLPAASGWVSRMVRAPDGTLLVAGAFAQRVRVGRTSLTAVGGDDVVVASLSPEGEPRWVRRVGSTGDDTVVGLAVDAGGNVTLTGAFTDTLTLGRHTVRSEGMSDVYVTSLSPAGEPRWLVRMGGDQYDQPSDLVVDGSGNVYVTGQIRRAGFYHGGRPTAYDDILLASVSSTGEQRWLHRFETRTGSGEAIVLHEQQGLCVAGYFAAGVTFGSVALTVPPDPAIMEIPGGGEPSTDAFVACFTPSGENRWARRIGGMQGDGAQALAITADGTLIVTGTFERTADFDGQSLESAGRTDVFLLSLPPARQVSAPNP